MAYKEIKVNQTTEEPKNKLLEEDTDTVSTNDDNIVDVDIDDVTFDDNKKEDTPVDEDLPVKPEEENDGSNSGEVEEKNTNTPDEKSKQEKESSTDRKNSNKPKKDSRSQKRIRELANERNELRKKLEEAEKARKELENQYKTQTKQSTERTKESIQQTIKALNDDLREAIQEGDGERSVALQEEIFNARMELVGLEQELKEYEKIETEEKETTLQQQQQLPEISEKAREWIEDHPLFMQDQLFQTATMLTSRQLVNEGFVDDSDEFYDELNERLSKRFPEAFGEDEENSVEYEVKNKTPSNNRDVKQTDTNSFETDNADDNDDDESISQVVSGAARTPYNSTNPNKRKVTGKKLQGKLTDEMIRTARRQGLDMDKLARRVAHTEKNRRPDGYVPIMIGNDD